MNMNQQLCVLLQIMLISSVSNNQVSAYVPNIQELRYLVKGYLIPQFQQGGLVRQGHQQFAVAILQPGNAWLRFMYSPSPNRDGQAPVINRNYPLSPPVARTYNNYLAARPYYGMHSETLILQSLNELYNAYVRNHNGQPPRALLLYSWIVPCKACTNAIVAALTKAPFINIPVKVVAYTTRGSCSYSACDVGYTERTLHANGIEVTQVYSNEEELMENLLAKLIVE